MQHERNKLNMAIINEPYIKIDEKDQAAIYLAHAHQLAHVTGEVLEWDGSKLAIKGMLLNYTLIDGFPWVNITEFGKKCGYAVYSCKDPLSICIKPLSDESDKTSGDEKYNTRSLVDGFNKIADRLTKNDHHENNEVHSMVYGSADIHVIMLSEDKVVYSTFIEPVKRVVIENNTIKIWVPLHYKYPIWPDKCDITIQCANEHGYEMYFDLTGCNEPTLYLDADVDKVIVDTVITYKIGEINGPYNGYNKTFHKLNQLAIAD